MKASVLNALVESEGIGSVMEFGVGDGHQLSLARYPAYVGFDVSPTAIEMCRERFAGDQTKRFALLSEYAGETAELVLSLDVIYHLVQDEVYEAHMRSLFAAAQRFVAIYSTDHDSRRGDTAPHVRHRHVTAWIEANAPDWVLHRHIPSPTPEGRGGPFADFYIWKKIA